MRPTAPSLALLFAALSGCSLAIDPPPPSLANRCNLDGSCAGAATCDLELGICVEDAPVPYNYVLEVTLPSDESRGRPALSTTLGPFVAGSAAATSDVIVRAPVAVAGRVRVHGDASDRPVEADILFAARPRVIGPPPARVSVSSMGTAVAGQDDFRTELLPGTTYDVEIRPRGEDAARLVPLRTTFDLEQPQRFDVAFAAPEEQFRFAGIVVDPAGVPQANREIRVVDAAGRLISSVATSSAEEGELGRFEIFVDRAVVDRAGETWYVRVSAPAAIQATSLFPTIIIPSNALVYEGGDRTVRLLVTSTPDPSEPDRPDDDIECFAGIVQYPPEIEGGGPVVGATVTLRSRTVFSSFAIYSIQVTTAGPDGAESLCSRGARLAPGGFEARVVRGSYDLEIRALDPRLGVLLEQREIERSLLGHVLALPARPLLSGVVQRSAEEGLMDARVRAVPLNTLIPGAIRDEAALLNRPSETLTDPLGNYQLPLDVGVYDLLAEPPEGSGFPWVVRPAFAMSALEWTEPLEVRHPVAIRGVARYENGDSCEGAQINAYAVIETDAREARSVPIGRAVTGRDGGFLLLLPPEIAAR